MENSLDLSRWKGEPHGLGYRRWAILSTAIRQLMRSLLFRIFLFVGWFVSFVMATVAFSYSQALATGGWIESWATHFGPRVEAFAMAFRGIVTLFDDVCIRALYTSLFWLQASFGWWLGLLSLTLIVPRLITRDRASNALTIYLSRPLTTVDYLLGKLGMIAGTIGLVWTGPMLVGWLLSLMMAPDRSFVLYSLAPLGRALLFNGIAIFALATIALGVSALARSTRVTTLLWLAVWLVPWMLAHMVHNSPAWLRCASFAYDLDQIQKTVLALDGAFVEMGKQVSFLYPDTGHKFDSAGHFYAPTDFHNAVIGLAVIVAVSSFIFLRKLKSE